MLKADGTADCDVCRMPMFPFAVEESTVRLECANHHHGRAPLPREAALRRSIQNWVAKRGAQLHAQHERWGTDDAREDDDAN